MKSVLVIALLLTGCAYMSEVISGTPDDVWIKAGPYANPLPRASEYCARYNKKAVLQLVSGGIYHYVCVTSD